MTMMSTSGCLVRTRAGRNAKLDLPAEIRVGEAAHPARVTTLHATGVELDVKDEPQAEAIFVDEVVVAIPSLGQYKARRLRRTGARAAYLFEVDGVQPAGAGRADRRPFSRLD
jgi:hypothetical protein